MGMNIPLFNRLKKSIHREIAMLQDEVVDIIYSVSPEAVFHGGTAIWRCYSGNRFSEDLDFYLMADEKFKEKFFEILESHNLQVLKYKKTENTVFSKVSNGRAEIRFEAALRNISKYDSGFYEKTDGSSMGVFVLSAEDLLQEKMSAYSNRKLVRDIYDVYFLSNNDLSNESRKKLGNFAKKIGKPLDEKTLKTIIYSGAIPSFEQMLSALKRRCIT